MKERLVQILEIKEMTELRTELSIDNDEARDEVAKLIKENMGEKRAELKYIAFAWDDSEDKSFMFYFGEDLEDVVI